MAPSPATAQRPAHESARPRLRPMEAPAPLARAGLGVVLRACRPRQWLKNVVVALAPAAAGALTGAAFNPAHAGRVTRPGAAELLLFLNNCDMICERI